MKSNIKLMYVCFMPTFCALLPLSYEFTRILKHSIISFGAPIIAHRIAGTWLSRICLSSKKYFHYFLFSRFFLIREISENKTVAKMSGFAAIHLYLQMYIICLEGKGNKMFSEQSCVPFLTTLCPISPGIVSLILQKSRFFFLGTKMVDDCAIR